MSQENQFSVTRLSVLEEAGSGEWTRFWIG